MDSWLRQRVLLAAMACAVAIACSDANPVVDIGLGNAAFPGAGLIVAGSPDNCSPGLRPTFTWVATGHQLVQAAVFSENLDVLGGSIASSATAVWWWHTGLGTAREGHVRFQDGVFLDSAAVAAGDSSLVDGGGYVWAVWAWSVDGTKVERATRELFFRPDSTAAETCVPGLFLPN